MVASIEDIEQSAEQVIGESIDAAERSIARRFGARVGRAFLLGVRWLWIALLIGYFGFGLLLLATRYAILPNIDKFRPDIEQVASRKLGVAVTIGRIEGDWVGLNPHLSLSDVQLNDKTGEAVLVLPKLEAVLSWISVPRLQPSFISLRVQAPVLEVERLSKTRYTVAGFMVDPSQSGERPGLMDWLLAQRRVVVTHARIRYSDVRSEGSGRAPLQFEDANFVLESGLRSHRFGLTAVPPAELAAPIDIRGRFRRPAFQSEPDFTLWPGELFAQMDGADLAAIAHLIDLPIELAQAQGAVRMWADLDHGEVERISADVALKDVDVRVAPELPSLKLSQLRGRVSHQRWRKGDEQGQEIALTQLSFSTPERLSVPATDVKFRTTRASNAHPERSQLEASSLDLANVATLAEHFPLGKDVRDALALYEPRGSLSNLSLSWDGPTPSAAHYSLKSRFNGLASTAQAREPLADGRPRVGVPGFSNLSGSVEANESAGSLQLVSRDATLSLPGIFEQPTLAFTTLNLNARWSMAPGLELHVDTLSATNADAEVVASGSYRAGGKGRGLVDLSGHLTRADAAAIYRYLPVEMGAEARRWLRFAVVEGHASEGSFKMKGDLANFPFHTAADGDLHIAAKLAGVTLDFAPSGNLDAAAKPIVGERWPALSDIEGDLVLDRNQLDFTAKRGTAYGVTVGKTSAHLAPLSSEAELGVEGIATGPLQDMVRYLNGTPVSRSLGQFTDTTETQGNATLKLKLDIPLHHAADTKVAGNLKLQNNDVRLNADIPPLTRLTGAIDFSERAVRFSDINGVALGGPIRLDASTRPDGAIVVTAAGNLAAAALRRPSDPAMLQRVAERLRGNARYAATITIKGRSQEIRVESDLLGMAVDAPPPLAKAPNEPLPWRFERKVVATDDTGGVTRDEMTVNAGRVLNIRLERSLSGGVARITRGAIGVNEPATLPEFGVILNVNAPRIETEAWTAIFDSGSAEPASPAGAAPAFGIDLVALRARQLVIGGKSFGSVLLGATRASEGGWNANLVSDEAVGALEWRTLPGAVGAQSLGRVMARFTKLIIPSGGDDVVGVLDTAPNDIPAIDVIADDFEIADKKLGRLELIAINEGAGANAAWRVQKLDISNPDGKFSATGEWTRDEANASAKRRMSLAFVLDASNSGALLTRLGIPGTLRAGGAKLAGDISWRGSPVALDYATLSGKVNLSVQRGQFLKVNPGAARLLSVLSLQSLARGISLDFRDLFSEGFAFDSMSADAEIDRGVLKTGNFKMIGPSATVLIDGTADLRNETQNMRVLILPEINAGSASLALAIANPAVGLATFLAQLLLRDPLSKAFSFEYSITGSWSDPIVKKLARPEKPVETK